MDAGSRVVSKPAIRDLSVSAEINPFRAQHLSVARGIIATEDGPAAVTFNEAESPLAEEPQLHAILCPDVLPDHVSHPTEVIASEQPRARRVLAGLPPQEMHS